MPTGGSAAHASPQLSCCAASLRAWQAIAPSCQGHSKLPGALRPARCRLPAALPSWPLRLATSCPRRSAKGYSALTQEQRPVGPACYTLVPQRDERRALAVRSSTPTVQHTAQVSSLNSVPRTEDSGTHAQHGETGLPVGSRSRHGISTSKRGVPLLDT